MTTRLISSSAVICILLVCSFRAFAQTSDRRPANPTLQAQEQPTTLAANMNSIEAMTNEIDLLRKSLQTLVAALDIIALNVVFQILSTRIRHNKERQWLTRIRN